MNSARLYLLTAALVTAPGCFSDQRADDAKAAVRAQQREISRSNSLIEAATAQLRNLSDVGLELTPPTVVLDSTSSADGQDVEAVLQAAPNSADQMYFNHLVVPAGNAGFKSVGVQPGDTLKYYIDIDDDTKARLELGESATGPVTMVSIDLVVGQVLDENTIRIVGALSQPVPSPHRLEVWRQLDDKMVEINNALGRYVRYNDPPLAWEPSPDAGDLEIIIERLNQWVRSQEAPADWTASPLVETLPAAIRDSDSLKPFLAPDVLGGAHYSLHDGRLIEEAVWARDTGRWAGGRSIDPVELAENLFDWTTRNITLTGSPRMRAGRPWQAMLYGCGTPAQRAWVFSLLCRQQRQPVLVLELPTENGPWLWCALLHEGKLHLFDPQLGLPIRNAPGEVATLAEVQADDALLRAMDLEDQPYPITSEIAGRAKAFIVADHFALSWRAEELQQQFSAENALTLSTDCNALAKEAEAVASIDGVSLWPAPFELLQSRLGLSESFRNAVAVEFRPYAWRPRLWKARVLHLRGALETEADARKRNDALYDPVDDHRTAGRLYTHPGVRPEDTRLAQVTPDKRKIYERAKATATYWMGLLQYERGSHKSADQWLQMATADEDDPPRRADGIRYNRARALEAEGELEAAAELLEEGDSLQKHGDRLRAKMLRERGE